MNVVENYIVAAAKHQKASAPHRHLNFLSFLVLHYHPADNSHHVEPEAD